MSKQIQKGGALGLGTRIYLSMIALVLISLIVIGVATLFFFKNQNDEYHLDRLRRKEQSVMLSLDYYIIENDINELNVKLENKIQELADVQALDMNVYTLGGELMGSTQIELFDNGTFSKSIADSTVERIKRSEQIIIQESVQDREYLSTYFILYTAKRKPMAIINLPYYKDTERNRSELYDFLATLAQVYVVLFIGASILAYFLSNYITNSLRTISEKLKNVRINGENQKLEWNGNDELSALVNDYNRMVDELAVSAQLLARSERESAWKEMAKQVAHEIKNPLTPMRLQLQHLQRIANDNPTDLKERMQKVSKTLVAQIDTLSGIASEFSDFAKMPKPELNQVDIDEAVKNTISLFTEEQGLINAEIGPGDKTVLADLNQLNRVLTNLITNAIQAVPENKEPRISVETLLVENEVLLRVTDNGSGIPKELQPKIFEPNFTTKSGGMGLGLAMVKGIIQEFNGKIGFVSELGAGTTFTVSIPLNSPNSTN